MDQEKQKLAQKWLIKSQRDLIAAKILAEQSLPIFDYAIFHCQQAAEKAIKALLVYHGKATPRGQKGHKLEVLIKLAKEFDINIDSRITYRSSLTELAVETRYPDYGLGTSDEFNKAFENAESFCKYIRSKIPVEAPPVK